VLSTFALGIAGVAVTGGPAVAADFNVLDRPSGAVTADGLPTAQIDGVVWDLAIVGDWVFAGGQFATARPAGSAPGVNTSPRSNLMSFNLRTGALTTWAPSANGVVRRLAVSPDRTRLYVGGDFTSVGGQSRSRVAAFDVSANNGQPSLVGGFAPVASSSVYALAATNSTVYLGGFFGAVNGVARAGLAAVQAGNGATTTWVANTSGGLPRSIALSPDQSRLLVAGQFSTINGVSALGMGSVHASTGEVLPFAANQIVRNWGSRAGFYSVRSDATNVYFTGWKFGGTGNFEGMIVANPTTGAINSMVDCHGDTYDVSPMNDVVYTVSHHHHCSNIGGYPDTNPRTRWQRTDGFTLAATTTVRHNNQTGYSDFFGQPAPSMLSWFPDVSVGSFTGQYQGGWTTAATTEYLVQGGEFPAVNGQGQQGLVRFAVASLAPCKQGMRATAAESAPSLTALSASSVRVNWLANFDRDHQNLTYRVYRGGTLVTTTTAVSQFWNRPTLSLVDSGLAAGTYTYSIVASDPDGNTQTSESRSITLGGGGGTSPTLASDTFSRTLAGGWGPADVGGSWTDTGNSNFSTNGSAALLNLNAGSGPWASLNSVMATDSTTTVSFSLNKAPAGNTAQVMLTARKSGTSEYQLRAQITASGSVNLALVALVNGTETTLATSPISGLSYAANDVLRLKLAISANTPTTLSGKVWRSTAAEPAQPQLTVTNGASGLQASGAVGVRAYLSKSATNGPITVAFDDFSSVRPA
jgi:hypothetical protein